MSREGCEIVILDVGPYSLCRVARVNYILLIVTTINDNKLFMKNTLYITKQSFAVMTMMVVLGVTQAAYIPEVSAQGTRAISVTTDAAAVVTSTDLDINTDARVRAGGVADADSYDESVQIDASGSGRIESSDPDLESIVYPTDAATIDSRQVFSISDDQVVVDGDGAAEVSSNSVTTHADLELYAQSVVARDSTVSAIELKDSDISVTYENRGRLFGFIPVTIQRHADVTFATTSGQSIQSEVKVKTPWWAAFVAGIGSARDEEAAIRSNLDTRVTTQASVNASTYAATIDAIRSSVATRAAVDTSVEAGVGR